MGSNLPEVAHLLNDGARTHPNSELPPSYQVSVRDLYVHGRILFRGAASSHSPAVPSPSHPAPTICRQHMPPKGNKPQTSSEVFQSVVSLCKS